MMRWSRQFIEMKRTHTVFLPKCKHAESYEKLIFSAFYSYLLMLLNFHEDLSHLSAVTRQENVMCTVQ